MITLSGPASEKQTSLPGYAPQGVAREGHSNAIIHTLLQALGGPAVGGTVSATGIAAWDDWTGGFDGHLGAYRRD